MAFPASEPDGQRSCVGTTIAARALRCSDETVKRQIKAGVLEGGRRSNGHWYVYKDQIASEDEKQLRQENAALRRQVDELTAAASNGADDVRRQLAGMETELAEVRRNELALQAENRELLRANQIQQAALSEMQEVLDEYLEGGEFALSAAGKFQSAGKKLSRVNASLNEHLALAAIPDTPAELDDDL
jgi:hypothetical protein